MTQRVAVLGAGLIGVFVGGRLAAAGAPVTLFGRARVLDPLRQGLRLTDLDGDDLAIAPGTLTLATDPAALASADAILVTVKSQHTESAAADIAAHARPGTPVLSLQNGVDNADRLRAALPGHPVIAGMVPFNVAQRGPAHYHRGTGGRIAAADVPEASALAPLFAAAGLPLALETNIDGVLWGKLLVNLNNAVNALSGQPLARQLMQRAYRVAWALCMAEGLSLVRRARIRTVDPLPLPLAAMPWLLRLPTPLYRRVVARAARGARVDPHARSSMADDLAQGRRTEIDHLNGAVVRLAARLGRQAPVNARVIALVRAAEAGAPPLPPPDLLRAVRRG